jgi:imidazolonepropionase-like amidohydrolase
MRLVALSFLLVPLAGGRAEANRLQRYLRVDAPRVVLEHVEVIDGTGSAPERDRNLLIEDGKIARISAGRDEPAQTATAVLHLRGRSVLPGIVGMHEHLFCLVRPNLKPDGSYDGPGMFQQMTFSAPRLYLAMGVTTVRTAGSVEPATDVKLKRAIERGDLPGPHMDVTGPYLDGPGNSSLQLRALESPEDARQTVAYWADRGVTSFKAYNTITRAELRAAIEEAHRRGLKITGHLCSVTYPEAVQMGIDNLEHGFFVNTERDPGKQPDKCSESRGDETLLHTEPGSNDADRLIALLVGHHVAVTSTLVSTASKVRPRELPPAALLAMAPSLREEYLQERTRQADPATVARDARLLRNEMGLERAFVAAGGLLMAGADPVGIGGLLPGFGDHREIELLVEAGFSPLQAIRIATLNGATYLGRQERIGSIAVGKNADLMVIKGDPAARIEDIENVEIVFKDGAGYDPAKLLDSVAGHYCQY